MGWVIGHRSAPFFRRGLEKRVLQSLKLRKSVDSNAFGENERSRDVVFGRHFDFFSGPGSVRDGWVRTFVTILLRDGTTGRVSSCSLGVLSTSNGRVSTLTFQLQSWPRFGILHFNCGGKAETIVSSGVHVHVHDTHVHDTSNARRGGRSVFVPGPRPS